MASNMQPFRCLQNCKNHSDGYFTDHGLCIYMRHMATFFYTENYNHTSNFNTNKHKHTPV